ncbi:MAG: hypothetical protein LCH79_15490 [Proteobacteria bacterium]|nr:hypothetical protein [Pseudomonadota bacterium]
MTDLNKLADALENIAHMEYPSGHHDGNNLREAAALLRAAAGVDVAGLMALADELVGASAEEDIAPFDKARAALESALRLVLAQRVPQPAPDFVPGVMHCARCKFKLHRMNLNVNVGTVTAGNNKTEPCPNGCGPLWPVTWKQEADDCMKSAESLLDRAVAAEKALEDLRARLGPQVVAAAPQAKEQTA